MARIRSLKPEAFSSESLAMVELAAERTFFGLTTQVDDQGRYRDHAAIIYGLLWSLRPDVTPLDVERHLQQLAAENLICRYTGCDGKRYLHLPTWETHQKINRPSPSRIPPCRLHHAALLCARCKQNTCQHMPTAQNPTPELALTEASLNPHCTVTELSVSPSPPSSEPIHGGLSESSLRPHCPDLGSRTVDLGSSVPYGTGALPARRDPGITAQDLIREWLHHCPKRPPNSVIGHLGKQLSSLLDEGIDPNDVRRGLVAWQAKGLHPSTLPSMVHAAMNATGTALAVGGGSSGRRSTTDERVAAGLALAAKYAAEEATQ